MKDRDPAETTRARELDFPRPVWRLRLRWSEEGGWREEGRVRVSEMTLPRSAALPATRKGRGVEGFWFEVVGAEGSMLYRGRPPLPRRPTVEVFGADGRIHREETKAADVEVEILVPEIPDAREVRLVSERRGRGEARRGAAVIHRLDFPGEES